MRGMKKRMKRGGSALKGGQSKLDKNKDGKITSADFAMMKKKIKKKKRTKAMGGGMMKKRMKRGGKVNG